LLEKIKDDIEKNSKEIKRKKKEMKKMGTELFFIYKKKLEKKKMKRSFTG